MTEPGFCPHGVAKWSWNTCSHCSGVRPEELVVCAAIRHPDGRIVCGARHYDERMIEVLKQLPDYMSAGWRGADQGFIDQRGQFLSREEAFEIAARNGQFHTDLGGDGRVLYSEDLY